VNAAQTTAIWWRPESRALSQPAPSGRPAFRALCAFTAILLLSPQAWFPVLAPLRIAFLAAGLAILAHLLDGAVRRHSQDRPHVEMTIAIALVAWSAATIPFSYWPGGSVTELTDQFLKAVAFFWLIGAIVNSRARLQSFVWLLVLCSIPLSLTAIQNYRAGVFVTTSQNAVQRIAGYSDAGSGLVSNPNDLALMLNILIPLAGVLAWTSQTLGRRLVASLAMLLASVAVFVTFSRAGFLGFAATVIMMIVALGRRQPVAAVAVIVVMITAGPLVLPSGYLDRIATITDIESDRTGSAQGRWADFGASMTLVAQNPIVGTGLGQHILALNELRGATWRQVHNVYLQYAVDLGLPGLLLFLWLFVSVFRTARRVRKQARDDVGAMAEGVQISLVTFAIAAFFHPVAYQFYFFCLAGLALAVKNAARPATT
jgi:putative inorganic carbon (HCO3(-)) transporter